MTDSPTVEFGELPPDGRTNGRTDRKTIVAQLKERPGEWAKVRTCPTKAAAHSSAAYFKRNYKVEAVTRGLDVWARWPEGEVTA